MSKINKILEYNLSEYEKKLLVVKWISNWCWKKWWFNFSNFFDKVQKRVWFKSEKFDSFKYDIKELCSFYHDIKFWEWWKILDFLSCNYEFWIKVIQKMHWTNVYWRFISFFIIFFWLSIFWISAFNWGKKRNIREILNWHD